MVDREHPRLSVVIASLVGPPFIDDCLASVEVQARHLNAEVIVVACGPESYASRLRERFPWVKMIHRNSRETVPALRCCGAQCAKGDLIAIIEEHCMADSQWLERAVAAHSQGDFAAVGGPVASDDYRRLRDWVVYFVEYNRFMPPWPAGETSLLGSANIVYRRQALMDHSDLLHEGYWEATLHPALLAAGAKMLSVPDMVVRHRGPFNLGYYLRQRYLFSRAFAGAQKNTATLMRRAAYLLLAPVLPAVFLARIARSVWSKRCHVAKFVQCIPLLAIAMATLVAGEWVGYLLGPGDALSKVE